MYFHINIRKFKYFKGYLKNILKIKNQAVSKSTVNGSYTSSTDTLNISTSSIGLSLLSVLTYSSKSKVGLLSLRDTPNTT